MSQEPRFIPVDLERIVEDLIELVRRENGPEEAFECVFRVYVALFQLELAGQLKDLKTRYRPFNPDAETIAPRAGSGDEAEPLVALCSDLRRVLERANFVQIPADVVKEALQKKSPRGIEVHVDLDAFDVLGFWGRGADERVDERRVLRRGLLRKERIVTPIHRRLCVFAKLKGEAESEDPEPSGYRAVRDDDNLRTDCVYIKLFRDIAHSDLEMLLPNTRVRMTAFDKAKLGVTGGGGTIGGVVATVSKIGVATNPMTWGVALVGFACVLWRQVSKVFQQRVRYMAALGRKLYCRNLDNNFGAITRLVELAEEEECKEALLAWFFLVRHGERGASLAELDSKVEAHLSETYSVEPDFEVADAVRKLRAAGMLAASGGETLVALPVLEARARLEDTWAARFGLTIARSGEPVAR